MKEVKKNFIRISNYEKKNTKKNFIRISNDEKKNTKKNVLPYNFASALTPLISISQSSFRI